MVEPDGSNERERTIVTACGDTTRGDTTLTTATTPRGNDGRKTVLEYLSTKRSIFDDDDKSRCSEGQQSRSPKVAVKEERAVVRSKILLVTVLSIAIVGVSFAVYFFLSKYERDEFDTQFNNVASQVAAVARENSRNTLNAIESFALGVTSCSVETDQDWPNVFIPDFPAKAKRFLRLSGALTVGVAPIIYEKDHLEKWEQFTKDNLGNVYSDLIDFDDLNATVEELKNATREYIFRIEVETSDSTIIYPREDRPFPWIPLWQGYAPPLNKVLPEAVNYNLLNGPLINETFQSMSATMEPVLNFLALYGEYQNETIVLGDLKVGSQILQPVFRRVVDYDNDFTTGDDDISPKDLVAVIWVVIDWVEYFKNLLPENESGIVVVMESSCPDIIGYMNKTATFHINGSHATSMLSEEWHDTAYEDMVVEEPFVTFNYDKEILPSGQCPVNLILRIYPTKEFHDAIRTKRPIILTVCVVGIFAFTIAVFIGFDLSVRRRQRKMMDRVIRQDRIVSNIFPSKIREKLYASSSSSRGALIEMMKYSNNGFDDTVDDEHLFGSAVPLAELYLSVSVIFADISGFTAWASTREPTQVFQLLERIYSSFDKTAYRTGVFKIETVGDCYVACAGLPEVTEDHIVAAAKFARSILNEWDGLTRKLEVVMGPDTTDLKLRIGIHTGQVTAGVLRGDKTRFQLFGDTVNVASRMENTSELSKIQLSNISAEMLREQGYGQWITQREDPVYIKGQGDMHTYWLESKAETLQRKSQPWRRRSRRRSSGSSVSSNNNVIDSNGERRTSLTLSSVKDDVDDGQDDPIFSDIYDCQDDDDDDYVHKMSKKERLIRWNLEILSQLLQQICTARSDSFRKNKNKNTDFSTMREYELELMDEKQDSTVLEEFKEIITLPQISAKDLEKRWKRARHSQQNHQLSDEVKSELYNFLTAIADQYNDENAFHNFEHASHVTASVRKLLSRIVSVDDNDNSMPANEGNTNLDSLPVEKLLSHSYGITSDPLTQFAVVFSAFIHDVDHPGVPNTQLVKEKTESATYYKEKSVAEQNSVDISWNLLMQPEFTNLRSCIYSNKEEFRRFRQLVVNVVMATDICDKELGALRKARWAVAFSEDGKDGDNSASSESMVEDKNRKATIVLEHLIQASDVAHTMQHWHIFRLWNERLFTEMYTAYQEGRAAKNPSLDWYDDEIGFFDFYVIPLAKKLDSCGVFGLSSHEYLNYATSNRQEWVRRGKGIINEYLIKFQRRRRKSLARSRIINTHEQKSEVSLAYSTNSTCSNSDDPLKEEIVYNYA